MITRIVIRHLCFAIAIGLAIWSYQSFGFRGLVIEAPYCVLMIGFGIAIGLQAPSTVRVLTALASLAIVGFGWNAFKQTPAYANLNSFSITADPYRCVIRINGIIPPDLPQQLEKKLQRFPQTRAITLSSSGGSSIGVMKAAELLRNHPINTAIALGQCDSACAFLWVTQKERVLVKAPLIITPGFHAPYAFSPWGPIPDLAERNAQIVYLKNTINLSPSFIIRAETYLNGVDRISAKELNKLGIKTLLMKDWEIQRRNYCGELPSERKTKNP